MPVLKKAYKIFRDTIVEFNNDNLIYYAASLSFYILLSLPSIIYILIATFGVMIGQEFVEGEIYQNFEELFGKERAMAIQQMIKRTGSFNPNGTIRIISIIVVVFTSTSIFSIIQDGFNVVWKVKYNYGNAVLDILKQRVLSFLMTIIVGSVFIVLILAQALSSNVSLGTTFTIFKLHGFISFVVYVFVFAIIIKLMSRVIVPWKSTLLGSTLAGGLFMVGKYLLFKQLAVSEFNNTYAAGAFIIILLWLFYSTIILFAATQFVNIYAKALNQKLILRPHTQNIEVKVIG